MVITFFFYYIVSNSLSKSIICSPYKFFKKRFFLFSSLIFSLIVHLFDIGSDIYVLIDLYDENLYYFSSCLGIILLSFIVNSLINLAFGSNSDGDENSGHSTGKKCFNRNNKWNFILSFIGILQLGIFYEAYFSFTRYRKTETFIWGRLVEGLIESFPQSLFQLFILMKKIDNNIININLWKFYLSISLSIISLAYGLVTFEQTRYDYHIKFNSDKQMIKNIKEIYILSPYGIVLLLYRLSEITSKLVLLSLMGYCGNGFTIIYFLLTELFLITAIFLIRSREFKNNINSFKDTIIFYFWHLIRQLFYLSVYWKPFSSYLPDETKEMNEINNLHWVVKTIMVVIYSYFIISKFISGYNSSFLILTTIGYSSFIISLILLFFIKKWNRINMYGQENKSSNDEEEIESKSIHVSDENMTSNKLKNYRKVMHLRYVDKFKPIIKFRCCIKC